MIASGRLNQQARPTQFSWVPLPVCIFRSTSTSPGKESRSSTNARMSSSVCMQQQYRNESGVNPFSAPSIALVTPVTSSASVASPAIPAAALRLPITPPCLFSGTPVSSRNGNGRPSLASSNAPAKRSMRPCICLRVRVRASFPLVSSLSSKKKVHTRGRPAGFSTTRSSDVSLWLTNGERERETLRMAVMLISIAGILVSCRPVVEGRTN
jgi:hypothetical protein